MRRWRRQGPRPLLPAEAAERAGASGRPSRNRQGSRPLGGPCGAAVRGQPASTFVRPQRGGGGLPRRGGGGGGGARGPGTGWGACSPDSGRAAPPPGGQLAPLGHPAREGQEPCEGLTQILNDTLATASGGDGREGGVWATSGGSEEPGRPNADPEPHLFLAPPAASAPLSAVVPERRGRRWGGWRGRGPHQGVIGPLVHLDEACHAASEERRQLGGRTTPSQPRKERRDHTQN